MVQVKRWLPYLIGIIFLYNGLLFSYLFIIDTSPFTQYRPTANVEQQINPSQTFDFGGVIGVTASSPFPNRIKIQLDIDSSADFEVIIRFEITSNEIKPIGSQTFKQG